MKAAVVTLSDKGFRNEREDKSGELVQMMLKEAGYEVAEYRLLPDEQAQIETVLKELSDEKEMDLILTTGGTGFSQRDCTPEATMNVATRNAPGIAEALLATAIGLVAAIPAVVIYNIFARQIGSYKAMLGDVAAQVLLLQSRDLDLSASAAAHPVRAAQKLRVG